MAEQMKKKWATPKLRPLTPEEAAWFETMIRLQAKAPIAQDKKPSEKKAVKP